MGDRYPDGITQTHVTHRGLRCANPLSLLVLSALMLVAFSGALGGFPNPSQSVVGPKARLTLEAPGIARSGMVFEMRMRIDAARAIPRPVIAISPSYWHELTINTMMPAADENYGRGGYRFEYAPLAAGDTLFIKVDGQVNPALFGGTTGRITLYDGETPLAALPTRLEVRP
ncbi:hypothetical protein [Sphingosinicella microcystinivorans]|uniref:Uncharacterized protein n=1 Tax=Sphingosinicella microcystinivorans TaxID=335406 RepID=A0AAD1G084_SPHMI|nr:hypothetical protein [Sphingosinicella microcystinivorans]RKS90579.1 hypothetical protein DFR51_0116 [Sphingosinicella microcystinivorans]BBE33493.1 hypothetical protein SmB9_11510 [Sphingosinicella microcystinivorans]